MNGKMASIGKKINKSLVYCQCIAAYNPVLFITLVPANLV